VLTLPILEVVPATPRARIVRIDLSGHAFDYLAGQAVLVAAHAGERRRPYSLATPPEDAGDVLELLVGVGAQGSPGPHLALDVGALVDVEGPVGTFTFPADPLERRFVFIAGGTGIAPLRAMLRHARGRPYDNIGVFYSARTPQDFAYEDELRAMAAAGVIELYQTVTRESGDGWTGARGRIDRRALGGLVHDPATLCFICGPPALVADMRSALAELGIAPQRIKVEEW
jgi:ferredoxin-NADP reductase